MGFDESPLLVIWETTQACDLACVHCRPSASPRRHASELTTEEAHRLLEAVREFGDPLMVFTGGDPLKRPDLLALLGRSAELGIRTTVRPSSTPLLTKEIVHEFRKRGVACMAIGLDGADAETHDGFRGVKGSFAVALEALEEALNAGLDTQIQTTLNRRNCHAVDGIAGLAERLDARMWSLFLPEGRVHGAEDEIPAAERAAMLERLEEIASAAPFQMTVNQTGEIKSGQRLEAPNGPLGSIFISHTGEIYPCGFLPVSAGNVRFDSLIAVYRKSPLFQELRDLDVRHGKCGFCEFREAGAVSKLLASPEADFARVA
jgi:AdoMet-dependent heme synthase